MGKMGAADFSPVFDHDGALALGTSPRLLTSGVFCVNEPLGFRVDSI